MKETISIGLGTIYASRSSNPDDTSHFPYMVIEPYSTEVDSFSHVKIDELTSDGKPIWSSLFGTAYPSQIAYTLSDVDAETVRNGYLIGTGSKSLPEHIELVIQKAEQQGRREIEIDIDDTTAD
jgi:hypothetical protein